jgi:hypothetical protein
MLLAAATPITVNTVIFRINGWRISTLDGRTSSIMPEIVANTGLSV